MVIAWVPKTNKIKSWRTSPIPTEVPQFDEKGVLLESLKSIKSFKE
jgi:hypothetical protein